MGGTPAAWEGSLSAASRAPGASKRSRTTVGALTAVCVVGLLATVVFAVSQTHGQGRPSTRAVEARVARSLGSGVTADLLAFGMPIYRDVTPATPRYEVRCTEPWGRCPLSRQPVPIPPDARPSPGSDATMVIVDPLAGLDFEFWQAHRTSDGWTASWGAVMALRGSISRGIYGGVGATGSGVSALYGVVTLADLASGTIDHPLVFSSSLACPTFIPPAVKSDGTGRLPWCIPEGGRVRLKSSVNLAAIPGITPFELTVGLALERYGAICVDNGGAPMALRFQVPPQRNLSQYLVLGATGDYDSMRSLPWSQLEDLTAP